MIKYLKNNWPINILFAILLFVNGCAYHKIEKLKEMPENSNNFSKELSNAYLEFALREMNDMHDEIDAAYFADKGIKAKTGLKVYPEKIHNWDINDRFKEEAIRKRKEILALHKSKIIKENPNLVAQAQLGFDCWLEQLEEGWQTKDIEKCYNMMNSNIKIAMNSFKDEKKISNNVISSTEIAQIKDVKEITTIEDKETKQKFEIYFEHDVFKLNLKQQNILNNIIKKYINKDVTIFEIVGHTDRSGTKEYNLILSKLRANAVRQFLLNKGLSDYNISTFYYGETKPKIDTKDGIKEKRNRRVEIFINNANQLSHL